MKEIWKDISEYEDQYQISNLGRVYSKHNNYVMKCGLTQDGYTRAGLSKDGEMKYHTVHRLVTKHFSKNFDSRKEVNHIDFCRTNNRIDNLELVTHTENIEYSRAAGKYLSPEKVGSNNVKAKLNDFDVLYIRDFYRRKLMKVQDLAKLFNIDRTMIHRIATYRLWKHIP